MCNNALRIVCENYTFSSSDEKPLVRRAVYNPLVCEFAKCRGRRVSIFSLALVMKTFLFPVNEVFWAASKKLGEDLKG